MAQIIQLLTLPLSFAIFFFRLHKSEKVDCETTDAVLIPRHLLRRRVANRSAKGSVCNKWMASPQPLSI